MIYPVSGPSRLPSRHISDPSRRGVTGVHGARAPLVVSVVSPGPEVSPFPGSGVPMKSEFLGSWIRLPIIALRTGRCKNKHFLSLKDTGSGVAHQAGCESAAVEATWGSWGAGVRASGSGSGTFTPWEAQSR